MDTIRINHDLVIVKQDFSTPIFLRGLDLKLIETYNDNVHKLTQYLVKTPNCLLLPTTINDGRIYRTGNQKYVNIQHDFLPTKFPAKTDPLWFNVEHPFASYINSAESKDWVVSCRKTRDFQIVNGENIGVNLFVNLDGDVETSCPGPPDVKRMNLELIKLLNDVLFISYINDIDQPTDSVYISKYQYLPEDLVKNSYMEDIFSSVFGTRYSRHIADRYIVNKMMIIFDNVQEILRKQPGNLFTTSVVIDKNSVNLLGYYAGNILVDKSVNDDCNYISSEVVIQNRYLTNEFLYPRNESDDDCKTALVECNVDGTCNASFIQGGRVRIRRKTAGKKSKTINRHKRSYKVKYKTISNKKYKPTSSTMWGNVRIPEHFTRFKRPFNEEEYKAHMESDKMKAYMQTPEYKENERLVNLKIKKMLEGQHEYENKLRSAFDKCNDNIEEFKRLLQEMGVEIKNKQFDDSISYTFTEMMNDKSR